MQEFDYIIIGAGSAGCVLADRLSESGEHTVCVIEHGGSDQSIFIQMPSALSIPLNLAKYTYLYQSEPEPELNGRRITCPRGKVLGGSSSINGLVYIRGNPADFDGWEALGAKNWSYTDVLPYFKRAENRHSGGNAWRGDQGKLATRYGELKNPLYHAFIAAAQQAGYQATDDVNGAQQEGFGRMDMTVKDGVRWSAANAYLRPALRRHNLAVKTLCQVTRILVENKRAVGVEFTQGAARDGSFKPDAGKNGAAKMTLRARREVILSAGSINSPKILQLSGIGAPEALQQHGIAVVHDLPGVGENLQDHLEYYHQIACTQPITLYRHMSLLARAWIGLNWLLFKRGLGATNHFESCGFIRASAASPYPDIQYHFLPLAVTYDGKGLASEHGFQVHVGTMRSQSRGHVRLADADPATPPKITFNYMSHPKDWQEMRACVRLTREIFAQAAFDPYRGRALNPTADITSDAAIDAFLRQKLESAYHPSCSCKMGAATDKMAVVGPDGRVWGMQGLRVIDSSIMPAITTGNLNAPTIMLAEKLADAVLGKSPLPRDAAAAC